MDCKLAKFRGAATTTPLVLCLVLAGLSVGVALRVGAAPTALDLAIGMDIPTNSIVSASFALLASPNAVKVTTAWGSVLSPWAGPNMTALSTGTASFPGSTSPSFVEPQPGTAYTNSGTNPAAGQLTCGSVPDVTNGLDFTELDVTLNVPTNAGAFSLKFTFLSAEYPEHGCTSLPLPIPQYNDRFIILLNSLSYTGNVAFDSLGNPVSVNSALFTMTEAAQLFGTGMDHLDNSLAPPGPMGAGIGWQTVWRPVAGGDVITLKFIIFDAFERLNDSVALIDDFEWLYPVDASVHPALEIAWPSQLDVHYQAQWTPQLNTNQWTNLGSIVVGNGSTNSVFDSARDGTQKFYRIQLVP